VTKQFGDSPGNAPDPRLVHPFFDLMVASFFIMLGAAAWFWWLRWRRREEAPGKWPLRALLFASPFGMIALESGWLVTEFGRQRWIARGQMRVALPVDADIAGDQYNFVT
jgi:cytochrome d ubiquinol oxidase subunit I